MQTIQPEGWPTASPESPEAAAARTRQQHHAAASSVAASNRADRQAASDAWKRIAELEAEYGARLDLLSPADWDALLARSEWGRLPPDYRRRYPKIFRPVLLELLAAMPAWWPGE